MAKLVNGVATYTDLAIFPGGIGFQLKFTVRASLIMVAAVLVVVIMMMQR